MNTNTNIQPVGQPGQVNNNQVSPTIHNSNPFQASDFSFDLDPDTGEMVGRMVQPSGNSTIDRGDEQVHNSSVNLQPSSPDPKQAAFDQKLANLEDAVLKIAMFVQGGQQQQQQTQQVQSTVPEIKLDFQSDDIAQNLVNLINQTIDKRMSGFEERLQPINQNLNQVNDRIELTDLAMKYGQDFLTKLPMILEYRKGDPKARAEALYLMLAKASPAVVKDGTTQTPNGSNNGQPQGVDQALQQRANQLATERQSITNTVNGGKPTKMDLMQSIDAAIASTYGQQ